MRNAHVFECIFNGFEAIDVSTSNEFQRKWT